VDLELYADQIGGKLVALVEVRCYTPSHLISSAQAHELSNKLVAGPADLQSKCSIEA